MSLIFGLVLSLGMEKPKVLIADDNHLTKEMYSAALQQADFIVFTARDGREAVGLALQHKPDVILMDIRMPEFDGHQAAKKIREDIWGRTAKILFLTNQSDMDSIADAVSVGGLEYIIKANTDVSRVVNTVREYACA